jgi:hypothetical protein
MKSFVIVEGKEVDTDDIIIHNIEEDIQGRDLVYFEYEGENYSSNVYVKR